MFSNQNFGAGAAWSFATVLLVALLASAVGGLSGDAQWLNTDIAKAQARREDAQTSIAQSEAQQALRIMKSETDAKIEKIKAQSQYETLVIQQNLQAKIVADQQLAEFRQNFFNTLNTVLMLFAVTVSLTFTAWAGLKIWATYQTVSSAVKVRHTPSRQAQIARQIERINRSKNPIHEIYTRPFVEGSD